jgi:hypothetical protein
VTATPRPPWGRRVAAAWSALRGSAAPGNGAPEEGQQPEAARERVRVSAVLAVALAVGVVIWLLAARGSGRDQPSATPSAASSAAATTTTAASAIGPVSLSAASLASLARSLGRPIYWAGPMRSVRYEVTATAAGDVYVRYLPRGVRVGDRRTIFLIVATYPYPNALRALREVAHGRGRAVPDGGFELPSAGYPRSAHLAYAGVPYQIEVFAPRPATVQRLLRSGAITPVG